MLVLDDQWLNETGGRFMLWVQIFWIDRFAALGDPATLQFSKNQEQM